MPLPRPSARPCCELPSCPVAAPSISSPTSMYTALYPVFPSALDYPHFPRFQDSLYTLYLKENRHLGVWAGFVMSAKFTVENLEQTAQNKEESENPWKPTTLTFCWLSFLSSVHRFGRVCLLTKLGCYRTLCFVTGFSQ